MMKKLLFYFKQFTINRYRWLMKYYYNVASDRFRCSVGDILLLRDVIHTHQFLLISRLLDVESFMDGTNKAFPYQNAISYKAYGEKHKEEAGNRSFKALIESYLKEGYHSDSYITCDRDMNLMDGNHRMGVHLYEGIEYINVRRVKRRIPFGYSIDWYYEAELTTKFIESVLSRFEKVQQWLIDNGLTFCAYIQGEKKNNLLQDMKHLCHVLKTFAINNESALLILFSIPNPNYTVKKGKLVSQRAIQIEQIMSKRIKDNNSIVLSKNCQEGKDLFEKYKKYIVK